MRGSHFLIAVTVVASMTRYLFKNISAVLSLPSTQVSLAPFILFFRPALLFAVLPKMNIDAVSMGGEHKVCAVWRYDKRAVNGHIAPVVYFATDLMPLDASAKNNSDKGDAAVALAIAEYTCRALDAVGLRDGPAHSEVKNPLTVFALFFYQTLVLCFEYFIFGFLIEAGEVRKLG